MDTIPKSGRERERKNKDQAERTMERNTMKYRKTETKEGTKEGRKEGRKEARKEGRKEGRTNRDRSTTKHRSAKQPKLWCMLLGC